MHRQFSLVKSSSADEPLSSIDGLLSGNHLGAERG